MIPKKLLKNNNFYFLLGYQLTNSLADKIFQFCIPWLVYDLTQSNTQMAFTFGIGVAPYLLFSVFGGAFIDYFNRRTILLITSAISGLTLLAFSFGISKNFIQPTTHFLYILNFLLATYNAFDAHAFEASVVEYFTKDEFISINTFSEVIVSFSNIVGPLIAGIAITFIGVFNTIFTVSLFYLISFILIQLSKPLKESSVGRNFKSFGHLIYENSQIIKEGVTYIFRPDCPIQLAILMSVLSNLLVGAHETLIVFLSRDTFGLNAEALATTLSIISIVSLITISLASGILSKFNLFSVMVGTLLLDAISNINMGLTNNKIIFFSFYALNLSSATIYNIFSKTFRQTYVPSHMIGRVSGIVRSLVYSATSVGALISGLALKFISVNAFFLFSGIAMFFVAIISFYLQKLYHPSVFNKKTSS